MNRLTLPVVAAGIALSWAAVCPAAPPATTQVAGPRAVVETGIREALAALRDPSVSAGDKGQRVQQILADHLDFDTLSRLAVGPSWREIPEAQRAEFVREFRQHVLGICDEATDQYTGQEIGVVADHTEPRGDCTVQTRITRRKADGARRPVAAVDFRLRRGGGEEWKVIDVTIDGVSLAANFRAQCQALMFAGGFDHVLQLLRDKNAARATAARESDPRK